jgi:hypothetical protein
MLWQLLLLLLLHWQPWLLLLHLLLLWQLLLH